MGGIEAALRLAPADRRLELQGRRARMICPSPSHAGGHENSPSFYVHVHGPRAGQGQCYGCGLKTTWRELVALLRLPREARFITTDEVRACVSDDVLGHMMGNRAPRVSGNDMAWPVDQTWRGVGGRLVNRVGGTVVPSKRGPAMLRLPVLIRDERVGHIDCTLGRPPTGELGYVNSPGPWAKHGLYPYDHVRDASPHVVCVVEGARDALVTLQNGCAAVATLGSQNWSERTARLLLRLDARCVVIMADPDEAGEHLTRAVWRDVHQRVDTRVVVLPSRTVDGVRKKILDPADLSRNQLRVALGSVGVVKDPDTHAWRVRPRRRQ